MDRQTPEQELRAYLSAASMVTDWLSAARALAVLRAAVSSGVLDAARAPSNPARIAAATGVSEHRVNDLCLALAAHGVLEREGGSYHLSHDFAALASSDAVQSLADVLGKERIVERSLENAAPETSYTTLSSEDALAVAVGVGMRPTSPTTRTVFASMFARLMPEIEALWSAGARHLELGCGAGKILLSIVATHPDMTAVGIELDGTTIAEARRRAGELGVADRVELRHMDARDLDETQTLDAANWSQQFFPAAGRDAVLAAAWRALKPGGYLVAPIFADPPDSPEALREPEGRAYALDRLLYGSWGVPVLNTDQLRAELEAAGFDVLRTLSSPPNPMLASRGVVLALRPPD